MKLDWRQIIVALLVGFVAGAALGRWARWQHYGRWNEQSRYDRMVERFSRKLDLTSQQREKVAVILETKRRNIESLRAQIKPKFEELRRSTKDEIRKILNSEQVGKFEKLEAEWAAKWSKRRDKHGGH